MLCFPPKSAFVREGTPFGLRLVFQRRIKLPAARRSMKKNLCEFPDAVYFPDRGRLFSVCNLGSSCGKYDFDYSKFNHSGSATDAGINLAAAPQSLLYDFKLLKRFRPRLQKGAWVLIVLAPFSSVRTPYPDPAHYRRYYGILEPKDIPGYSPEFAAEFTELFNAKPRDPDEFRTEPEREKRHDDVDLSADAESFLRGWKKEFEIADFNAPISGACRKAFEKMAAVLQDMLSYCSRENLRPALLLPPVSRELAKNFTPDFRRHYILDFIEAGSRKKAPLLDHMDDPRFLDAASFENSLWLNPEGAAAFTACILKELEFLCT